MLLFAQLGDAEPGASADPASPLGLIERVRPSAPADERERLGLNR